MRDPKRIPVILAALERRWRQQPDLRLGQLLDNVCRDEGSGPSRLFTTSDGEVLRRLGAETDEERAYVAAETGESIAAWRDWLTRSHDG